MNHSSLLDTTIPVIKDVLVDEIKMYMDSPHKLEVEPVSRSDLRNLTVGDLFNLYTDISGGRDLGHLLYRLGLPDSVINLIRAKNISVDLLQDLSLLKLDVGSLSSILHAFPVSELQDLQDQGLLDKVLRMIQQSQRGQLSWEGAAKILYPNS